MNPPLGGNETRCVSFAHQVSAKPEDVTVTIPADRRRRLDIKPGDTLRWTTVEEGNFSVELFHQREGVSDIDSMKALLKSLAE